MKPNTEFLCLLAFPVVSSSFVIPFIQNSSSPVKMIESQCLEILFYLKYELHWTSFIKYQTSCILLQMVRNQIFTKYITHTNCFSLNLRKLPLICSSYQNLSNIPCQFRTEIFQIHSCLSISKLSSPIVSHFLIFSFQLYLDLSCDFSP